MRSLCCATRIVALCLPLMLLAGGRAWADADDAKSELGTNAAMKYWQAFGLLPALNKEQEKLVHEWKTAPLDAAALKLIDESQGSREYLLRGAKLQHCDWSLDYDDGIFLRLPYLPKS